MIPFLSAAATFAAGNLEMTTFHADIGLRLADKTLILGTESVVAYFLRHPTFFVGMERLSPDSPVTVTYRNQAGDLIKLFSTEGLVGKIVEFRPTDIRQRIRLTIEYDGTDFAGFQTQNDVRTVQKELETILSMVNDYPTAIAGASRTDAGVHAYGQVVHFDTKHDFSESKWKMILSHALPGDIGIKKVENVHPLFHARYDVIDKEYRYVLNLGEFSALKRNYEWTVERKLDLDILQRELDSLVGTFDFASFCKGENSDTVRTISSATMLQNQDHLTLSFIGDGFLHNMIRLLVGSLVDISSGKSFVCMQEILSGRSRKHTTTLAPSGGLYLMKINY
jgi:tRNA pseudouridine38-40 synthase